MNYSRTRKVKQLTRGTKRSAGIDFYIPEMDAAFLLDVTLINKDELASDQIYIDKTERVIVMAPGAHILIPSGIKCDLTTVDGAIYDTNRGIAYIAQNKSGVSKNKRLDVAATLVDEDYQGEIHLSLVNTSNRLIKLKENEKIVQFIATQILLSEPQEILAEDIFKTSTERGSGAFGSTEEQQ